MGSAGNWQTEDGIVMNEEERAVATLLAAMRSGIADFDTAPLCAPARHYFESALTTRPTNCRTYHPMPYYWAAIGHVLVCRHGRC
eukprot:COSAG02_NODE_1781_length_10947_cov_54.689159_3_plen_85_part_00